jgi:chromosome segregation ATPase
MSIMAEYLTQVVTHVNELKRKIQEDENALADLETAQDEKRLKLQEIGEQVYEAAQLEDVVKSELVQLRARREELEKEKREMVS